MNKILEILKIKEIDRFLLLHYPIIWKIRLLYLLPFLVGYTILLYIIPFDFIMNLWGFSLLLSIFIVFNLLIFRLEFLNKNKLNGLKEYFLYLFICILMLMPFIITIQANKYILDKNQPVYNDNYHINKFEIMSNKCYYKVTKDKNRELDKEEKEFIATVIQAFSDKNLSKLSKEEFTEIIDSYNKIALWGMMKNNFEVWIIILFLLPFLLIFSKLISDKPILIIISFIYMGTTIFFIKEFDLSFINKSIEYLNEVNTLGVGILFLIATIFTYLYKIKLNYITAWLVFSGLILYFFIFHFYIHLNIFYSGLLVVLNILFIISSFKEKLIILNARPEK